ATTDLDSASTIPCDTDGADTRYLVGGLSGWVANPVNGGDTYPVSRHPPNAFVDEGGNVEATGTDGSNQSDRIRFCDAAFNVGGYYYLNEDRYLFRSSSPYGPLEAVWDPPRSNLNGQPPNGASIQAFMDGVQVGDRLYCTVSWHFQHA